MPSQSKRAAPTAQLLAPYLHLLGNTPDPEIERLSGVDKRLIFKYRVKHGITCNRARITAERTNEHGRLCSTCDGRFPLTEFTPLASSPDGLDYRCRVCDRARHNAANATPKGKAAAAAQYRSRRQMPGYAERVARYESSPRGREVIATKRRKYNQTIRGRDAHRADNARYCARPANRHKLLARVAVVRAVAIGALVRPDHCAGCGTRPPSRADGRPVIEGHHPSYERAHWLDVEWLCKSCHAARHSKGA